MMALSNLVVNRRKYFLKGVFGESKIKILSRPGKMGLGSAYSDGLKLANGSFVFLMDADM